MASKIILKKSSVAAKAPVAGDLDFGELAINYTDSKLYFKKADGSIDAFSSAAASAPVTSVGGNIGAVTDAQLLASIKNVDGTGSGLDADFLDGLNASAFYLASNPNGYTSNTGTVTSVGATAPLVSSGGNTPSISIPAANSTTNGFMSSAYASKLDGIAAGAQVNVATNLAQGTRTTTAVPVTSSTGTTATLDSATTLLAGVMSAADKSKLDGIAAGATANTGTVTSVATSGTVSGLTLTGGTITTSGTITLGGTLSAGIANISDAHRWWNNFGDNHSTRTAFDTTSPSYNFGWRYVQGSTNGPGTGGNQFYSLYTGLGNEYPATGAGSYGMFMAIDRDSTTPYLSIRYNENNSLSTWRRISAGRADNWTTARTLTVGNTGKSVDGSANVAWSLAEIGAYAASNPSGYTTNTGTVTSVGGTGGYGGLTLSGTVTTSGNLTLGGTPTGTWPISVSGNAATATNATNLTGTTTSSIPTSALATGTANSTTFLRGDRTWGTISAGAPGGSTTQVQFNNAGAFGGDTGLTYNSATKTLTISGIPYSNGATRSFTNTEIAIGVDALANATTASNQIAIGNFALNASTSGSSNTAVGSSALQSNTTGSSNVALGSSASRFNTTGINNVSVGLSAGEANQVGSNNTAIGRYALSSCPGYSNTAIGSGAGSFINDATLNYENTAVGRDALSNGRIFNCAVGFQALGGSHTGSSNTAVGHRAGVNVTSGTNNVLIGRDAGTDAVRNVTTGANNIVIGNNSSATAHIKIAWTVTSDARDKTSFAPVPHGLAFVNALTPTAYQFRVSREDETPSGPIRYGFKAQDILALEGDNPIIIDNKDPENLKYNQDSMIAVLLNAIKELDAKFEAYKAAHPD